MTINPFYEPDYARPSAIPGMLEFEPAEDGPKITLRPDAIVEVTPIYDRNGGWLHTELRTRFGVRKVNACEEQIAAAFIALAA